MISSIHTSNLGAIREVKADNLGAINLIIGPNQSGKTFLLKALFSAIKTVETYRRGKENRSDKEILSEKLYWTFQTSDLGNIVRKGEVQHVFSLATDKDEELTYTIGHKTTKQATVETNTFAPRSSNSIFIPAKEILSIRDIILEARDENRFGFEEPYCDLAKALNRTQKGKNYNSFSAARDAVKEMVDGRLEYNDDKKEWQFRDNSRRIYEIASTSEGVKKLSILDLLLGNHYLDSESVIIIDEIEANLHPSLITKLLDAILILAKSGVQFFIASHSYFVIKRLYIMAHRQQMSVPVLSFDQGECSVGDLQNEMPQNPIIAESINLYKDEISL
ncbi:MAG: AAA family ATPase [Bacteroidales bacterium]|nr:AAA family ATPase [Bacteroidales bacterium]